MAYFVLAQKKEEMCIKFLIESEGVAIYTLGRVLRCGSASLVNKDSKWDFVLLLLNKQHSKENNGLQIDFTTR